MARVTQLSCAGVPGRRYAPVASVFGLETLTFLGRTSVRVLGASLFPGLPRFMIVTESCQRFNVGIVLLVPMTNPVTAAPLNVSAATDLKIKVGLPNGSTKDFAAQFLTDGTDGKIFYVTSSPDDLPVVGTYQLQGRVSGPGFALSSRPEPFDVFQNVDDV